MIQSEAAMAVNRGNHMGLDGVEIVMRIEETFGIEIPDKIAQQILTPAALVDFIAANVPCEPTEECLSQQLFYRSGEDSGPN
jgi:hypothetical protein